MKKNAIALASAAAIVIMNLSSPSTVIRAESAYEEYQERTTRERIEEIHMVKELVQDYKEELEADGFPIREYYEEALKNKEKANNTDETENDEQE